MASQDARLSKFEANFKQQQGEMTNKIDTFLKAINDRMTGALPSDMVKNPKLNDNSTPQALSAHSYPTRDPQSHLNPANDGGVMLIEIIKNYDDSSEEELGHVEGSTEEPKIAYKMPHKIEQYNSLSDLEKEHMKFVYLRNEEDKTRGVESVMSKILGFYNECLELGAEY
ncbi:hypothetical protein Tco_0241990 [Tanacetum coccineum]